MNYTFGGTGGVTAAPDLPDPAAIPALALGQNFPNPFNPLTEIPVDLAAPAHVTVRVYDLRGRLVADTLWVSEPGGRRASDLATRNVFAAPVLVPVHTGSSHSRVSLLCLGSWQAGQYESIPFGRFKLGARVLAFELHEWWLARLRTELMARARITEGDLELLRHQSLGHSSKRIAAELQVSRSSINSRFQRMNSRLGVANRRIAARLAAECGLILP